MNTAPRLVAINADVVGRKSRLLAYLRLAWAMAVRKMDSPEIAAAQQGLPVGNPAVTIDLTRIPGRRHSHH
jgi:hypothetical protein